MEANMILMEAQKEVQALIDTPGNCAVAGPRNGGDGRVVERLQKKQKELYDQLVSDLQKELAFINNEILQREVKERIIVLKQKLQDSKEKLETELSKIVDSDHLTSWKLNDLEIVWQRVEPQFDLRLQYIESFKEQLEEVERKRSHQVCDCLKIYASRLRGVAYVNDSDTTNRIIEEHADAMNMNILAVRRLTLQVCSKLTTGERRVWQEVRGQWRREVEKWKKFVLKETLQIFRAKIGEEEGNVEGEEVRRIGIERGRLKEEMVKELSQLHLMKMELLTPLSLLSPSTVALDTLNRLEQRARRLDTQITDSVQQYLLRLGREGEVLVTACEKEMELCKKWLLDSGVCDSTTVYQVLTTEYLPLIARLGERCRIELQNIERAVEIHIAQHMSWFHSALQYGIGAVKLWEEHFAALAEVKKSHNETLHGIRISHDAKNQNGEANLDIVLDHMRQSANEEILEKCLTESTALLDLIKQGYEDFHEEVVKMVRMGPEMVNTCVLEYDKDLCDYVRVARQPPFSKIKKNKGGKTSSRQCRKPTTPNAMMEEVIIGSGAVRFYPLPDAETDLPGVFLTQSEESEGAPHIIANQAFPLNKEKYTEARTKMRMIYLEHLTQWRDRVKEEVEKEVREREEEAHGELDLRLHLHQSRKPRISRDIYNVRAAELESHRDRMGRHARAVVAGISDSRAVADSASIAMAAQEESYKEEMKSLTQSLTEIDLTSNLQQVEKKAKKLLEERLKRLEDISNDLCSAISTAFSGLSFANTHFRESLRSFSEAGNYCPEEIELFSQKLDKLSSKLAVSQPQILNNVTLSCSSHCCSAHDVFSTFQTSFQLYWSDVCHLEDVKRSLVHLQLSIRSVVTSSNLQANQIEDKIKKIQLESGDHTFFLKNLPLLVDLLTQRIIYLHCRATVQQGGRVGAMEQVRRGGGGGGGVVSTRQPISAVNVSNSIRLHTKINGNQQQQQQVSIHSRTDDTVGTTSRKKMAAALVERRNINFGVGGGEENSRCFLPHIRSLLGSIYSDLFSMTERYYYGKGSREVVCKSLASNCEGALDRLIDTCQLYRRQCEDYRNKAISEFRDQLERLLSLMVGVASSVMDGVLDSAIKDWERGKQQLIASHKSALCGIADVKEYNQRCLEPGLGHPAMSEQFKKLKLSEEQRHCQSIEQFKNHTSGLQLELKKVSIRLIHQLREQTTRLLSLYDTVPTTNMIIPGYTPTAEKIPVQQLLRLKISPSNDVEGVIRVQSSEWPGLSVSLLERLGIDEEQRRVLSSVISSRKCSEGHKAVIKARDIVFEEFTRIVEDSVTERRQEEIEEHAEEEKWWKHWNNSVNSVALLYSLTD